MRSFCVITSVASISSCGQLLIPAGYLVTARAYVLIPWIFLLFSQLLSTCFNFWGYLTVADLHKFLCSCWFAGYPGSTSCSLYLLFCLLVAPPIHSGPLYNHSATLIQLKWHPNFLILVRWSCELMFCSIQKYRLMASMYQRWLMVTPVSVSLSTISVGLA